MQVLLKNPNAPATQAQLWKLHKLTGEDTRDWHITMQEASDRIDELEVGHTLIEPPKNLQPFDQAKVTLIEAEQGQGKSCTAVGRTVDAYYIDCVKNWCREKGITGEAKGYIRKYRIAMVKVNGTVKYYRVHKDYKLHSDMRIFANFHLYGIPYVYVPSFGHLLKWMKMGLLVQGRLLIDETYVGANARDSMTAFGKELEKQSFQLRKMQLEVDIITPHARLIDKWMRTVPTKHILCSYDAKRREITLTVREKGKKARTLPPFDAMQYFPNYWTNERINR